MCDRGYAHPEYVVHGQLTKKADVYSFGIVVLEILSGRKCADEKLSGPKYILEWDRFYFNKLLYNWFIILTRPLFNSKNELDATGLGQIQTFFFGYC